MMLAVTILMALNAAMLAMACIRCAHTEDAVTDLKEQLNHYGTKLCELEIEQKYLINRSNDSFRATDALEERIVEIEDKVKNAQVIA